MERHFIRHDLHLHVPSADEGEVNFLARSRAPPQVRDLCLALLRAQATKIEHILAQGVEPLEHLHGGGVLAAILESHKTWVIEMALDRGWIDLEKTYIIDTYTNPQSPLEVAVDLRLHTERISELLHRTKSQIAREAALLHTLRRGVISAARAFLANGYDLTKVSVDGHMPLCYHTKYQANNNYVRLLVSIGERVGACTCTPERPYWYPAICDILPSSMMTVALILAEMEELRMDFVVRYAASHERRFRLIELLDQNITIQRITRMAGCETSSARDNATRDVILSIAERNRQIRGRIVATCVVLLAAHRFHNFVAGLDKRVLQCILRDHVWPTRRNADVWRRVGNEVHWE